VSLLGTLIVNLIISSRSFQSATVFEVFIVNLCSVKLLRDRLMRCYGQSITHNYRCICKLRPSFKVIISWSNLWQGKGNVCGYLSTNTLIVLSEWFCSREPLYKYHQTVLDTFLSVSSVNINQSN